MKHITLLMVLAMLLSLVPLDRNNLYADQGRRGQAGYTFLKIPLGARQVGMGNAALGSVKGAQAMFWNPAGIALQSGYQVQFSHLEWFGDIKYEYFSGTTKLGRFGHLGIGVQYLGYPDIIETTELAPDGTGATFTPYDVAFILSYARKMSDRVAVGVNAKYINETIALVSSSSLAFDIGFSYDTGIFDTKLGFVISNYGTKGQFQGSGLRRFILRPDGPPNQTPVPVLFEGDQFELPSSVNMGISVVPVKTDNLVLTLNADQVVNSFARDRTNLGGEIAYEDMLYLRGGWTFGTDYSEDDKGSLAFGGGVRYEISRRMAVYFDYAWTDLGFLDNAQYFTVGLEM